MEQNFGLQMGGLKCDNPACDWKDEKIAAQNYTDYINMACPKCGENVLTFDDYVLAMELIEATKFLNTMTPEQVKELSGSMSLEEIKNHPLFKHIPGVEDITDLNQAVVLELNAHKEVSINKIKPLK